MSNIGQPFVPAGWFDDPAGSGRQRWWNGSEWTEHLHDPAAVLPQPAYGQQPTYAQQAPHDQQPAYVQQQAYGQPAYGQQAPDAQLRGARVYNAFIWVIALLPALTILLAPTTDYSQVLQLSRSSGRLSSQLAMYSSPAYLLSNLLSIVMYGATVLLAYFDWRTLTRIGYARPFHWAWAFLTPLVYIIGRSAVIKRRAGRGLLPIWVWVGLTLIGSIVIVARIIPALTQTLSNVPSIGA